MNEQQCKRIGQPDRSEGTKKTTADNNGLCLLVYLYLYFVYYCLYLCSLPVCILVNKAVYNISKNY